MIHTLNALSSQLIYFLSHTLFPPRRPSSLRGCYYISPNTVCNCHAQSMEDSALRPKSPLAAKLVLIQRDLWAPCYQQQAEARERQPSRSNDSTLLSAMCCQHEGCHPYLFWLVSINLRETKRGGFPGLRLCVERPGHSVVWHALCCFSCADRSLTSLFSGAHTCELQCKNKS